MNARTLSSQSEYKSSGNQLRFHNKEAHLLSVSSPSTRYIQTSKTVQILQTQHTLIIHRHFRYFRHNIPYSSKTLQILQMQNTLAPHIRFKYFKRNKPLYLKDDSNTSDTLKILQRRLVIHLDHMIKTYYALVFNQTSSSL